MNKLQNWEENEFESRKKKFLSLVFFPPFIESQDPQRLKMTCPPDLVFRFWFPYNYIKKMKRHASLPTPKCDPWLLARSRVAPSSPSPALVTQRNFCDFYAFPLTLSSPVMGKGTNVRVSMSLNSLILIWR